MELRRGQEVDVAFIPASLAKVGKVLKIKKDGEWDDGWRVMAVYSSQMIDELTMARRTQKEWMTSHDA